MKRPSRLAAFAMVMEDSLFDELKVLLGVGSPYFEIGYMPIQGEDSYITGTVYNVTPSAYEIHTLVYIDEDEKWYSAPYTDPISVIDTDDKTFSIDYGDSPEGADYKQATRIALFLFKASKNVTPLNDVEEITTEYRSAADFSLEVDRTTMQVRLTKLGYIRTTKDGSTRVFA